tara:strand:+ start:10833 stop:11411 length:579 start_codon:yes stop_codon:yes gene_type:complete
MKNPKLKFLNKLTDESKVTLGLGALIIKDYRVQFELEKLPSKGGLKCSNFRTKKPALPIEEQEILLELRADCGLWCVPGGRLDPGESIEECVKREIKEETNIDVILDNLFCVYSHPETGTLRHYLEDDFSQQVVDIFLIGLPISDKIKKSEESLDVKFFKFEDVPSNIVPTLAMAIKDYKATYRLNGKPILR